MFLTHKRRVVAAVLEEVPHGDGGWAKEPAEKRRG